MAESTLEKIKVVFPAAGTYQVIHQVTANNLTTEKVVEVVIKPEPTLPPPSNFTASTIASAVVADGGTVDATSLTEVMNALPTYIKEQATMFVMIPTASKTGKYYSFDNDAGTVSSHNFVRASQATAMSKTDTLWLHQINEPAFEYTDGYQAKKQAVINSILANPNRKYVVNYLPSGYVTNGTVNYGAQLNNALDAGLDVIMPDFPIMVNNSSFSMNDGQRILFQANSELRLQPGLANVNYAVLPMTGKKNIVIVDARIRGDKGFGGLSDASYEKGQGINMTASKNCVLYDPLVRHCWGDGIYTSYTSSIAAGDTEECTFYNAVCHNNGRNNISITCGYNIWLYEPILVNADKSNPVAGLDIEPNGGTVGGIYGTNAGVRKCTNIFVKNIITWGNWWSGIQIGAGNRYETGDAVQYMDITIENHLSDDECFHAWLSWSRGTRTPHLKGTVLFLNSNWNNTRVYSAPPGGGLATTSQPLQDGNKIMMRHTISDSMMTLKFHHPKIYVNGVQYTQSQLQDWWDTDINGGQTVKQIILP